MSLESSIGPRRYQAILGILVNDCGIDKDELGDLKEYLQNPTKLELLFDYKYNTKRTSNSDQNAEVESFNQRVAELLNKNDDQLWKKIDKAIRIAAYEKDFNRIVEKFNPNEDLKEKISYHLKAIYSGGKIEDPFNELKIILISERLKKKGVDRDCAVRLAMSFVKKEVTLELLKQDPVLADIIRTEGDAKIEAIFTKYVAFGKISDATQLRKRTVGKIFYQFQKKFAEEIHDLDKIKTVEMKGNEILFRGINSGSGLTEELIRQQFEDVHIGESTLDGVAQQFGSYRIMKSRSTNPEIDELGNRASFAVASSANFAVAAKYARKENKEGESGWIFDIRPKKGRVGVNLHKLSQTYSEIDFEALDPEEIYAVYKISTGSIVTKNEITTAKNNIEEVILNPHYKKRRKDK